MFILLRSNAWKLDIWYNVVVGKGIIYRYGLYLLSIKSCYSFCSYLSFINLTNNHGICTNCATNFLLSFKRLYTLLAIQKGCDPLSPTDSSEQIGAIPISVSFRLRIYIPLLSAKQHEKLNSSSFGFRREFPFWG